MLGERLKKHLPEVAITETDTLKMSIKSAEELKGRGPISKTIKGGLPEWNKPRKFNIE